MFCSATHAQNKIYKGRVLGIDPDGKVKIVQVNGKTRILNFNYKKIDVVEEKDGKSRKSNVFKVTIGDKAKLTTRERTVTRIVFEKTEESLKDFLFKSQKVKMMRGRFKQLDTNNMKLYLYDEPEFMITPYTKYIPHYGQFVSKDSVIVGYIDGLGDGVKIAKWVRLKERK